MSNKWPKDVQKMSKKCPKMSGGAESTICGYFVDLSCQFGRCFCLVALTNARPLQLWPHLAVLWAQTAAEKRENYRQTNPELTRILGNLVGRFRLPLPLAFFTAVFFPQRVFPGNRCMICILTQFFCVQLSQFEFPHAYALLLHPGFRHQTHIGRHLEGV